MLPLLRANNIAAPPTTLQQFVTNLRVPQKLLEGDVPAYIVPRDPCRGHCQRILGGDPLLGQPLHLCTHPLPLVQEGLPPFAMDEPDLVPKGRQPHVRIVTPEQQPVLRSARQHPVGLPQVFRD